MWESDEGASVIATRQYAGNIKGGAAGAPPRPPPRPAGAAPAGAAAGAPPRPAGAGGTKAPAGFDSTAVNVTFGSVTDFKFSQGVCAEATDNAPEIAKAANKEMVLQVILEGLAGPEIE